MKVFKLTVMWPTHIGHKKTSVLWLSYLGKPKLVSSSASNLLILVVGAQWREMLSFHKALVSLPKPYPSIRDWFIGSPCIVVSRGGNGSGRVQIRWL